MAAKSMFSYSNTLYAVLQEMNPERCFEWGPGTSTQILALYPSVNTIDAVENEIIFYDMLERLEFDNLNLHYVPSMDEYVDAIGNGRYDLAFIDGRDRVRCLDRARDQVNLAILHDAARHDYREAVNKYGFRIWTDEGNTVALTNDEKIHNRLKTALKNLECDEPKEEIIYMLNGVKA